jgi:hypothetical protein
MSWAADPASARKSMRSLADATAARRHAAALKSRAFFADAGQSADDYEEVAPRPPTSPRKPRTTKLHRRSLSDVLRPRTQSRSEPDDA